MRILHGENIVASRAVYLGIKETAPKKGLQPQTWDGQEITLADLATAVNSVSLLGGVNALFIENFFSLRKTGAVKKDVTAFLLEHSDSETYLWESKDVSTQLRDFPPQIITLFKLPTQIFQFLDTFSPSLLPPVLENTAPEQLLALLAKQIQKLIQAKSGQLEGPDWQVKKILRQAEKYSLSRIVLLHDSLVKIDLKQKTSSSPHTLSSALELWALKAVQ